MSIAVPEARTAPAVPVPAPAQRGGALSLAHMSPADAWRFAEALAGSGMLPRQYQGNPASVLWALEYGRAIGLDVITTTQSVHVIQGRATASADLMASLTRRAGHRMRIAGDDSRAEVVILRADDPEFEFRAVWDAEKARRAKLDRKDTWQQFPGAMLRARAISECVRMACPEVLHGSIYTPEEIGATVDADGMPVTVEVQQQSAPAAEPEQQAGPPRDYLAEAQAAATADEVIPIYRAAEAAGAVPQYLDHIKAIGAEKRAEEKRAAERAAVEETTDAAGEASWQSETAKQAQAAAARATETAAARAEMYAAAEAAGLTQAEADDAFKAAHNVAAAGATAEQLRAQAADLRAAMGGGQ